MPKKYQRINDFIDAYQQVERDYADKMNDWHNQDTTSVHYYPPGFLSNQDGYYPPKSNSYYDIGGIEVIDYIKAKLTPEQYKGYLLGNIYKYSGRMQYKGDEDSDIKKLSTYTNWLMEEHEANA